MRYYCDTWKFKHPKPTDFFESFNEGTGVDLSWYFDQFFRHNKTIDYEIGLISHKKWEYEFIDPEHQLYPDVDLSGDKPIYLNRVDIKNNGNGFFPMELELWLKEGTVWTSAQWNHKVNYSSIEFLSNSPLQKAQLDPQRKVVFDLTYSNNGKEDTQKNVSGKFIYRWQFWAYNITQILGGL